MFKQMKVSISGIHIVYFMNMKSQGGETGKEPSFCETTEIYKRDDSVCLYFR